MVLCFASCSESDNDFLESCRASALLAELEDDDELPEPDDEDDEENEDENEDDDEYDDVLVSHCMHKTVAWSCSMCGPSEHFLFSVQIF